MGWKERLKPASWRNIKFFVEDSELEGGRKTVQHGYPQRDIDYTEDLGRRTRIFSITAYVLGDDYDIQRNALQDACEDGGIGDLVHPYHGTVKVQLIEPYRVRERSGDGRIAIFDLVFAESEEPTQPTVLVDSVTNLLDKVNAAIDAITAGFNAAYDVFQQPQNVIDDISKTINNATVSMEEIKSNGKKTVDFQNNLNQLKNNTLAFIYSGADLALAFISLFTGDDSLAGVKENLGLKDFQKDENIIEPNNLALTELIQQAAVIGSAKAISGVTFTNVDEAYELRDLVAGALDDLLETINTDLYLPVWELRIATIDDVDARADQLPELIETKLIDALPSLYVSYDLYEDIERAQEIVDRNNVMHPGFVPGGVTLEVLSRE